MQEPLFLTHMLGFFWSELYLPYLPFMERAWGEVVNILPVIMVATLFQWFLPAVTRKPKVFTYEYYVDIFHVIFNSFIYLTYVGTLSAVIGSWMQSHTPVFFGFAKDWPEWVQIIMAIWMFDFLVYWRHRLSHEIGVLWPIHAVHHTSQQVDVLTTHRLHFLEVMAGGIIVSWAGARSGLSMSALMIGFTIYIHYNHFIHSNIRIKFPGFLRYILVSPFMHRWHHAREKDAVNTNYGVVFAWNDWLFGTAYYPDREPLQYGIEYPPGEETCESYINHQVYPFMVWMKRIFALLARYYQKMASYVS